VQPTNGTLSSEPETDQQNQDKHGQNAPRDNNDFDSQFANVRDVIVDVWITIEETVAIAKNIRAAYQIDDEEECRGYSQSRKN